MVVVVVVVVVVYVCCSKLFFASSSSKLVESRYSIGHFRRERIEWRIFNYTGNLFTRPRIRIK